LKFFINFLNFKSIELEWSKQTSINFTFIFLFSIFLIESYAYKDVVLMSCKVNVWNLEQKN